MSCSAFFTPYISIPSITDASGALSYGTNTDFIPISRASMTIGRTPFIRLISPFRDISPMKEQPSSSPFIIRIAFSTAMNMAISCTEPLFLVSAGARLTMTCATGKLILHERRAERILSRLSLTTVSGSPTISN